MSFSTSADWTMNLNVVVCVPSGCVLVTFRRMTFRPFMDAAFGAGAASRALPPPPPPSMPSCAAFSSSLCLCSAASSLASLLISPASSLSLRFRVCPPASSEPRICAATSMFVCFTSMRSSSNIAARSSSSPSDSSDESSPATPMSLSSCLSSAAFFSASTSSTCPALAPALVPAPSDRSGAARAISSAPASVDSDALCLRQISCMRSRYICFWSRSFIFSPRAYLSNPSPIPSDAALVDRSRMTWTRSHRFSMSISFCPIPYERRRLAICFIVSFLRSFSVPVIFLIWALSAPSELPVPLLGLASCSLRKLNASP
mmetsp:Transcript_40930/g.123446  ORF Transcript_40930/g.123446 Transcript_40930/m.123446 type:complete len:316 (+) Transcript_40930:209-1156(+)